MLAAYQASFDSKTRVLWAAAYVIDLVYLGAPRRAAPRSPHRAHIAPASHPHRARIAIAPASRLHRARIAPASRVDTDVIRQCLSHRHRHTKCWPRGARRQPGCRTCCRLPCGLLSNPRLRHACAIPATSTLAWAAPAPPARRHRPGQRATPPPIFTRMMPCGLRTHTPRSCATRAVSLPVSHRPSYYYALLPRRAPPTTQGTRRSTPRSTAGAGPACSKTTSASRSASQHTNKT